jgi:hypothetical protein
VSFAEEWAVAEPMPAIPAHPRCRCTVRAVYRTSDGQIVGAVQGADKPVEPPALKPADLVTPVAPPAMTTPATMEERFAELEAIAGPALTGDGYMNVAEGPEISWHEYVEEFIRKTEPEPYWNDATRAAWEKAQEMKAYWRGLELDQAMVSQISADDKRFASFLGMRYGVSFGNHIPAVGEIVNGVQNMIPQEDIWAAVDRAHTISALEIIRQKWPRYVVDSEKFQRIIVDTRIGNQIASMSADGRMSLHADHLSGFRETGVRSDTPFGIEEVVLHEAGHSVHNRYGAPLDGDQGEQGYHVPVEPSVVDETIRTIDGIRTVVASDAQVDFWDTFRRIREASAGFGGTISQALELVQLRRKIAQLEDVLRNPPKIGDPIIPLGHDGPIIKPDGTPMLYDDVFVKGTMTSWQRELENKKARLAELEGAGSGGETYPTDYSQETIREDFAESFMLYLLNPEKLRRSSPARYEFMRTRIMEEKER